MQYSVNITTEKKYDVIVAGSGPAGIGAAISSARNGMKTLLIESLGRVGGISTSGLMSHFTGNVDSGLYREILAKSAEKNYFEKGKVKIYIDPEMLTVTYMEMLEEAGVDILLYTTVCEAVKSGDKITGVICYNKSGFSKYNADVVIDATGDGDVAYKAGAEYVLGRESDGKMQPATLMFKMGGVDMDRAVLPPSFETLVETEKGELQSLGKKILPSPAGHILLYPSTIPGIVTCNMTNVTDIDGTNAFDLTKAEITCRKQLEPIVKFLREYAPGYENCYIISTASLIGIRETRHFKGLKTLTENDISQAKVYEDAVVFGAYFNFDIHNISGPGLDKNGVQKAFNQKNGYTIPYGCLVPKTVDGLVLSGRNISGTHIAHSNFRAMPICIAIGEAGGVAASIAVKKNIEIRNVLPIDIQKAIGK